MNSSARKNRTLDDFHSGNCYKAYDFFGCHKTESGYVFRVWAPHAKNVFLLLDRKGGQVCKQMSLLCDGESYGAELYAEVGDTYNFLIHTLDGRELIKADPYAFCAGYPDCSKSVVYSLPEPLEYPELFEEQSAARPVNIYEVNLLSWKRRKDNSYYTYSDLERELVPYVKNMGYTHVEFMPVTEFPFDGSWGYQVTGYFAATSRLGAPRDFKNLIDAFHREGIKVILDWVPAHFPKDEWGLYEFDGQPLYESALWDNMEHRDWGTRKFDFGREEVNSFLLSGAYFFFDRYRVDGLRVDAVASMLYLDYDRQGDFTPNKFGGNLNLESIEFIKKFNIVIHSHFKGAITVAEESTAFDGVTREVGRGGLGFDYKWNMGWMNDVLFYCRQDPYYRNYHHNKITFSLVYAFSENFILPLSHDEVVHVKGSIINKMPCGYGEKFAGERSLLAYMYAHPGKKLNFMGYEVAQFKEWDYRGEIEFFLKKFELHAKMQLFVRDLNFFYKESRPLYEEDGSWEGFEWLVVDDKTNNVVAFSRYSKSGESLTAIINFSGVMLSGYRIGVARGKYRVAFNTDGKKYGGEGKLRKRVFNSCKQSSHGKEYSIVVDIPKLTCLYLKKDN